MDEITSSKEAVFIRHEDVFFLYVKGIRLYRTLYFDVKTSSEKNGVVKRTCLPSQVSSWSLLPLCARCLGQSQKQVYVKEKIFGKKSV